METPGPPARTLMLPAASRPRRKRAAGEAGPATSRQRVLDEEEYIEVGLGADDSDVWARPAFPLSRDTLVSSRRWSSPSLCCRAWTV